MVVFSESLPGFVHWCNLNAHWARDHFGSWGRFFNGPFNSWVFVGPHVQKTMMKNYSFCMFWTPKKQWPFGREMGSSKVGYQAKHCKYWGVLGSICQSPVHTYTTSWTEYSSTSTSLKQPKWPNLPQQLLGHLHAMHATRLLALTLVKLQLCLSLDHQRLDV